MTGYQSKKAAARDKLAQPEQEPIAARPCRSCDGSGERYTGIDEAPTSICIPCKGTGQIVFAQPAQEPVAMLFGSLPVFETAPPSDVINKKPTKIFGPNLEEILNSAGFYKRTWVDLTDAEIDAEANSILTSDPVQWWRRLARAVLAKSKEKNNG
jgi:hypothetical protein